MSEYNNVLEYACTYENKRLIESIIKDTEHSLNGKSVYNYKTRHLQSCYGKYEIHVIKRRNIVIEVVCINGMIQANSDKSGVNI
ncbi:hypothetical protein Emin_0973 [Elusimicrobium minutum Pei191]|uniref:Uncharacterized protein n=1 Tax=Elusimicrobium minutum (strain Pei191) TaxID=445932 RepID=B2KDD0_ELUMP|nr:hypothetical protein Emin_0973 [Elusimicrobium minutum Pei191]